MVSWARIVSGGLRERNGDLENKTFSMVDTLFVKRQPELQQSIHINDISQGGGGGYKDCRQNLSRNYYAIQKHETLKKDT